MKREDFSGAAFYIRIVGKMHQFSGRFIDKPNPVFLIDPFEAAVCIPTRLPLNAGQHLAFFIFFRFCNANWHSINEQCVIHRSGTGRKFAHCHPKRNSQVQCFYILNDPTAFLQLFVNLFPCFCFRSHDAAPALLQNKRSLTSLFY